MEKNQAKKKEKPRVCCSEEALHHNKGYCLPGKEEVGRKNHSWVCRSEEALRCGEEVRHGQRLLLAVAKAKNTNTSLGFTTTKTVVRRSEERTYLSILVLNQTKLSHSSQ